MLGLGLAFAFGSIPPDTSGNSDALIRLASWIALIPTYVGWEGLRKAFRRVLVAEDPSIGEILAKDGRPPKLYLRPFENDTLPNAAAESRRSKAQGFLEESFSRSFEHIGLLVAVGMPGEQVTPRGASRFYVTGDEWQVRVLELAETARLILCQLGSSPGIVWEIEAVLSSIDRRRMIFFIAGRNSPELERMRDLMKSQFQVDVPRIRETVSFSSIDDRLPVGYFLHFDNLSRPNLTPVFSSRFEDGTFDMKQVRIALNTVLLALNLKPRPFRFDWRMALKKLPTRLAELTLLLVVLGIMFHRMIMDIMTVSTGK